MIFLKYTERYNPHKKKLNTGFYITIACCLLIIGGAAWFALSSLRDNNTNGKMNESENENSSYNDNTSSYIESTPEMPILPQTQNTNESVESELYTSKPEITVEKISFSMPCEGEVLKHHSLNELQYSETFHDMRLHSGIDIACSDNTQISACGDGKVIKIESNSNFGNVVTIEHKNGITIKYCSLENLKIKENDTVKLGDIIGSSSSIPSECNDKPHIHIEVLKDGQSVDPIETLGFK